MTEVSGRVACENKPLAPRCGRVHDFLLIGWWWGSTVVVWKFESSTFRFQPVWSLRACGHHPSLGWGVLVSAKQVKDMCQVVLYTLWGGTRILFYHWTTVFWLLLFCFCISSRSLITETYSRAHIVARLRAQDGFGPKIAYLISRKPRLALFLWGGGGLPYMLTALLQFSALGDILECIYQDKYMMTI